MDSFARNYSIGIGLLAIALVAFWGWSNWEPRARELDQVLAADAKLANYPYRFRVRDFENGVAVISTPRSFDLPAIRFLEILHPNLVNRLDNDPLVLAAQQELIDHQKHAMGLIQAQPGVTRVDWELDTRWLADRGIHVPVPTGGQ